MDWSTGQWASGSGALIDDRHVLTCSHNLIDPATDPPPLGQATAVHFYPAFNQHHPDGPPPDGVPVAAGYFNVNFQKGEDAWDIAVCLLADAVPVAPTYFRPTVTGAGIVHEDVELTGYPGIHEGQMYEDTDQVAGVNIEANALVYTHDTWSGNSGSPVWTYDAVTDTVAQHGIHVSRGAQELRRAILVTKPVLDWVGYACAQPAPAPGFALIGL